MYAHVNKWEKKRNKTTTNAGEDGGEKERLNIVGVNVNSATSMDLCMDVSHKTKNKLMLIPCLPTLRYTSERV
jgi:hypothetical protein